MIRTATMRNNSSWLLAPLLVALAYGCGSPSTASPAGGVGSGGANGNGSVGPGGLGTACSAGNECQSGRCVEGTCGSGVPDDSGMPSTTPGPHWDGSGTGYRPLTAGCGPDTATQCTGTCEQSGGDPAVTVVRPPATLCFAGQGDATPEDPSVVIEQVIEELDGVRYIHLRVTFDPSFVDNTYGAGACCGWAESKKGGHTFNKDLTGSDHTELLLTDGDGETVMNFKLDLISEDANAACGYATQGVLGGDGEMLHGDPAHVLAVATSIDRNINGCGYCQSEACAPSGDCTIDSPATDDGYSPNAATTNWDYRAVYEVWIAMDAFGDAGFGQGYVTYTHASPSKGEGTIEVEPTPCPPEWDVPYCPPSVIAEGGNCFGTPSGEGGAPGGDGGGGYGCPPNQQTYIVSEGASTCTPIPYANYPGMAPCPSGYHLDITTEGRYCLPD